MDQSNSPRVSEQPPRFRHRGRLLAVAFVVVLLALLVLTPPLVNVNRYRKRIITVMSQSLGRPVHLDNVSLHLLPVPGLTLQNLVVSEDPAFGYEPVIRANTVEATLRASSLWRRQVEFSRVRFVEPSVNLVRNPSGRWNLEEVLMQASRIDTAPTTQRTAGPAPRFPYIEATGARVNIKLGQEKMPYSLADSQFALWLPSPQQWRLRLQGKPLRTDSNLSETGTLQVEGSLQHAANVASVPMDIHASWRGAPLGEGSRLLTGEDKGWRGTLFLEIALSGTIAEAVANTHLQLNDLRRADFVPAKPLDVTLDCTAKANLLDAALRGAQCVVPIENAQPLALTAAAVDLQSPAQAEAQVQVQAMPLSWAMDWARLFSAQLPAQMEPGGVLTGNLAWSPAVKGWQGRVVASLPNGNLPNAAGRLASPEAASATTFAFNVDTAAGSTDASATPVVKLDPVVLRPTVGSAMTLSGQAESRGYTLQLTGSATPAQIRGIVESFPPLGEAAGTVLGTFERPDAVRAFGLSCTRQWGAPETCAPLAQPESVRPPKPTRRPRHRR